MLLHLGLRGERGSAIYPEMIPPDINALFPKLRLDGGKKTSEATNKYNCIGWSVERTQTAWYEPKPINKWETWPSDVPDDYSLDSFIFLFERRGYRQSDTLDTSFNFFIKKVAIYAAFGIYGTQQWEFTHVSDQLNCGLWTSKLGKGIDIFHNTPNSLEGQQPDDYGKIYKILWRRCSMKEMLARLCCKVCKIFNCEWKKASLCQ